MTSYRVYIDDHCVSEGVGVFDWMHEELKRRNNGKLPKWCKHLMWDDIEDFALYPTGELALLDECGNYAVCPDGLFRIEISPYVTESNKCPSCGSSKLGKGQCNMFCESCGFFPIPYSKLSQ